MRGLLARTTEPQRLHCERVYSSLWHASCILIVLKRLVNTHFIRFFVLVHLLSISLSLVNNYYTISLLSLINVPCKYTFKDFTTVVATKSSLFNRRCSIIATGYLLPLRARPKYSFSLTLFTFCMYYNSGVDPGF